LINLRAQAADLSEFSSDVDEGIAASRFREIDDALANYSY